MRSPGQSPVLCIEIGHPLLDTTTAIVECLVAPINFLFNRVLDIWLNVSLDPLNKFIFEEIRLYKIFHFWKLGSVVSRSTEGNVLVASDLCWNTVAHLDLANSGFYTVNIGSTLKTLGALPFSSDLIQIFGTDFSKIRFQFGKIFRDLSFRFLSFSFPLLRWNCVLLLWVVFQFLLFFWIIQVFESLYHLSSWVDVPSSSVRQPAEVFIIYETFIISIKVLKTFQLVLNRHFNFHRFHALSPLVKADRVVVISVEVHKSLAKVFEPILNPAPDHFQITLHTLGQLTWLFSLGGGFLPLIGRQNHKHVWGLCSRVNLSFTFR